MIRHMGLTQRVGTRLAADFDVYSTFPEGRAAAKRALPFIAGGLFARPHSTLTTPTLTDLSGETQP